MRVYSRFYNFLKYRPPTVRFLLPLTPPQGTDIPPQSLYREVGTKDLVPYVSKFNNSASRWTKADLDLLGVDYQCDVFDDITIGIHDMPEELLQGHTLLTKLTSSHRELCSEN